MNFLHSEYQNLGPENLIEVTLDAQANVTLLDDSNFYRYRSGQNFEYRGGLAKRSPVFMSPPYRGHWHLVVDLGGYAGNVNVGTRLVR
jgi:hypothetical protein